jgi:hypothetical protein
MSTSKRKQLGVGLHFIAFMSLSHFEQHSHWRLMTNTLRAHLWYTKMIKQPISSGFHASQIYGDNCTDKESEWQD